MYNPTENLEPQNPFEGMGKIKNPLEIDKDGEKILTCYNTNMSNLVFCGMLDWAKMEIYNQAREESEE